MLLGVLQFYDYLYCISPVQSFTTHQNYFVSLDCHKSGGKPRK